MTWRQHRLNGVWEHCVIWLRETEICHDFVFWSHYINVTMHFVVQSRRLCEFIWQGIGQYKGWGWQKNTWMASLWKGQIRFHTRLVRLVRGKKVSSLSIIIHLGYWIDYGVFPVRNWVTQYAILCIQMKESNLVLNLFFSKLQRIIDKTVAFIYLFFLMIFFHYHWPT